VIGLALILAAGITSLLTGFCLRLQSLLATLIAAYVAWVANLALVTQVLSPLRGVTQVGLGLAELVLLSLAVGWWWRSGRPSPPPTAAKAALADAVADPATLAFLCAVTCLLGYELLLALTVPPDNWDSLSYHLARVAAWYHHGGVYWVPNAPTDRINEFQPVAEQQILFLFVATGTGLLYAVPQYVAQLALLAAVFGIAGRLGYGVRPAACAACLFATFGVVAYEATTAQNDLVAASLVAAAAFLLLGEGRLEASVAGVAAGIGLGVKLTTVLAWPVLLGLAALRGRRTFLWAAAGATAAFLAIGCWSFVLNLAETGHLLGHGGGRAGDMAAPSYPGSLATLLSILYTTMDLSVLWPVPIAILALAGLCVAAARAAGPVRRKEARSSLLESTQVGIPFVAPALVIVAAAVLAFVTRALGNPVRGPDGSYSSLGFFGGLNNTADEDASAFGPVGAVVLWGVPIVTAIVAVRRKVEPRQLLLAAALPTFLILLAIGVRFNPWFSRFLIIPAALTAPLLAGLFRGRATTLAYLVVSAVVIGLGIARLDTKRLVSPFGAPWHLTQLEAVAESAHPVPARALARYDTLVPARSRVGAVLTDGDPSYLLGGANFGRRIVYLPLEGTLRAAARAGLEYVVIADQPHQRPVARTFAAAGWSIRDLAGYWLLAVSPVR
jgi:hypothetical protein